MSDPNAPPPSQHRLPGRDDAASLHELCEDGSEVVIDVVERRPRRASAADVSGEAASREQDRVVVPQGARDLIDGLSPYGT